MYRVKITVRIHADVAEVLAARARRQHRGISNAVETALCIWLRLPSRPFPDRPHPLDHRYTARPRKG